MAASTVRPVCSPLPTLSSASRQAAPKGQHAAAGTRAGPWFSDPQPPQMLDMTSGPHNRKLKHPVDKAALCPVSSPGFCCVDRLLPGVSGSLSLGKEPSRPLRQACQMTHSPDLSFSFSFLSLFFFSLSLSLRVGVVRQPDEQSICMSFAEKGKQTPAVGSGERRKGHAHGVGAWSPKTLPFFGNSVA